MNIENTLKSIEATNRLINQNRVLLICGEEEYLKQLDKGNWIGGTIPYCMSDKGGGLIGENAVFVTDFTDKIIDVKVASYSKDEFKTMLNDRYLDGFSYVVVPAFSEVHEEYGLNISNESNLFDVPTMGWVTGVYLEEIGLKTPKVMNGKTGELLENKICALHCQLPEGVYAELDIINIYEQGNGDVFTFPENSFSCSDCLINGEPGNLAEYYLEHGVNRTLPLVANYAGVPINVDIQDVDAENKTMSFFGPLNIAYEYKIANLVEDRYALFCKRLPDDSSNISCSCNCISSYLNIGMEGKHSGGIVGPFTFGEIAYVLVNQTMVTLSINNFQ
ncbi:MULTISPECIES: DUF6976 family protein [unclassified Aureispira]|uniref:DUF6976 family protein n=1 Tax=unclassified Aureispira TaxID=2649989 RepID=UPI0006970EC5|nr:MULTISPECIES: hypothetical protein [unclassified Aureispira]WMX15196.1 hypothetical protein QP953_02280 [Aureispira sp. CCB-E]